MAPSMRVSSSPAPRSLRSLPSSDSGTGRSGKGVRPSALGPHPAFQVLGAFHRDTYSLRQRQLKEGDLPVPILSSILPFGGEEREKKKSQALWPVLLLEAGQKGWGSGRELPPGLGGWQSLFGVKETGATASERSPLRGEGKAQQNPVPPKCIRWRKSISSGEQIECIKLA